MVYYVLTMKRQFPAWSVPIALFIVCLVSFGLLISQTGYYWDDWPSVYIGRTLGSEGYREFFSFDRPTTYISYSLLTPFFGLNPLGWQIFTLFLRFLTSIAVWWFLSALFPRQQNISAWSAVLFAASPIFTQQSIAFTYHQLWMEYFFFMVSLAAMLQAVRSSRWRWHFTALALVSQALNLSISEYFMGIELLRVVFLYLVIAQTFSAAKEIGRRAFRHWLPYLLMTAGYVIWRLFLIQLPAGDRNAPSLLYHFLSTPLAAVKQFIEMVLQDVSHILVGTWYRAIAPQWFDLDRSFYLLVWLVSFITAAGVSTYLLWLTKCSADAEENREADIKLAVWIGLLAVLFGPLPGWLTGRQVSVGMYSERLAVPAMLGASLLAAALIEWMLAKERHKVILVGILVGLAVGINLRTANDYRWSWIEQKRFAWQLAWRAPAIQPGTAILAEAELIRFVGNYSTAMTINLIYPPAQTPNQPHYWFINLGREYQGRAHELRQELPLKGGLRQFHFSGRSTDSLVIFYKPSLSSCLRILSAEDEADPSLPEHTRAALPVSNLNRITAKAFPGYPPVDIFGAEPEQGWCYFYQKAALARQFQHWSEINALAERAAQKGYHPLRGESNTPQEWLPFVEAFARTGRVDEAVRISEEIARKDRRMDRQLCALWQNIRRDVVSQQANQHFQELGCGGR